MNPEKARAIVGAGGAWAACTIAAASALHLLYSAYCALTWGRFTLLDYGVYTNMIWNCGYGDLFRYLVDRSYLQKHLSFTLALLGPLFRVWDHPFLLALVQWALAMAGALILFRSARKQGVPPPLAAAVLLFGVGYAYVQSVLLAEFHGVSLYLFLVPWLYWCLSFRKSLVILPLALILGLREEAFLLVLPMLLYFAIRDRWPAGYVYLALALAYGLLAVHVIYPAVNGASLFRVRRESLGLKFVLRSFDVEGIRERLVNLLWIFLPALAFVRRRGWVPLALFPLAALLQVVLSGQSQQYRMTMHYPAAVMALLGPALVEAAARVKSRPAWAAAWLVGATVAAHLAFGLLPGGGDTDRAYRRMHPRGRRAIAISRSLPKNGLLVCSWKWAAFFGNRADFATWNKFKPGFEPVDLAVFTLTSDDPRLDEMLAGTEYGVVHRDEDFLVLQRGLDPAGNGPARQARAAAQAP